MHMIEREVILRHLDDLRHQVNKCRAKQKYSNKQGVRKNWLALWTMK